MKFQVRVGVRELKTRPCRCKNSPISIYSKEACHIKRLLMGLMLLTVDVE